ncbi:MAG: hypothetical protein V4666_08200 [Bacteroidota bacterium]
MIQINLNSKWFTLIKYFAFAIVFHVVLGWFGSYSNSSKKDNAQKIIIPAEKGSFESTKPESKPLEIKKAQISETKKDGLVYIENPLNKKLLEENEQLKLEYSKMSDSLKSKTYEKAIELNSFHKKFEDKNVLIDVNGTVRGEVQELNSTYEIKERQVEVHVPETVLRVFIGTGIGINTALDRGAYKLDVNFMNKKGDMFSGEYLRVNGQDFGMIGIKKSILNIKR